MTESMKRKNLKEATLSEEFNPFEQKPERFESYGFCMGVRDINSKMNFNDFSKAMLYLQSPTMEMDMKAKIRVSGTTIRLITVSNVLSAFSLELERMKNLTESNAIHAYESKVNLLFDHCFKVGLEVSDTSIDYSPILKAS